MRVQEGSRVLNWNLRRFTPCLIVFFKARRDPRICPLSWMAKYLSDRYCSLNDHSFRGRIAMLHGNNLLNFCDISPGPLMNELISVNEYPRQLIVSWPRS